MILDSSALLALIRQEPGQDVVQRAVRDNAAMSALNLSEVIARLADQGWDERTIRNLLDPLPLSIVDFDAELAYRAGLLRPLTRAAGLSLGDRCCLALAQQLDLPVLTADRSWQSLRLGVRVDVIR